MEGTLYPTRGPAPAVRGDFVQYGGCSIPGLTCPGQPFPAPFGTPVPVGFGLPAPLSFGAPLATPVATPLTGALGIPLPTPAAPYVVPAGIPFPTIGPATALPFPAAPTLSPFAIPFAPLVPQVFGIPFCA
jgi:hypothetical protein